MTPEIYESSTLSTILAWLFFCYIIFQVGIIAASFFTTFMQELGWGRAAIIFAVVCTIAFSPLRHMVFLTSWLASYPVQSFGALGQFAVISSYGVFVWLPLIILGFGPAFWLLSKLADKHRVVSLIVLPIALLFGSWLYSLYLPVASKTFFFVGHERIIKATNGPAKLTFKYVASPFSAVSMPAFFSETEQSTVDAVRCHASSILMTKKQRYEFVKGHYPQIVRRYESETQR